MQKNEIAIVNYRDGSGGSRYEASVNMATGIVSVSVQTVENSTSFSISRASLGDLTAFLSGVLADLGPLPEVVPDAPVDGGLGTGDVEVS